MEEKKKWPAPEDVAKLQQEDYDNLAASYESLQTSIRERKDFVEAVSEIAPPEAFELLLLILNDTEIPPGKNGKEIGEYLARLIRKDPESKAWKLLVDMCANREADWRVLDAAVQELCLEKCERCRELLDLAGDHFDAQIRKNALKLYNLHAPDRVKEKILNNLHHKDPLRRNSALHDLPRENTPVVRAALKEKLGDNDPRVRVLAAEKLIAIGVNEGELHLREWAHGDDLKLAYWAAYALAEMQNPHGISAFQRLTQSDDPKIREWAGERLEVARRRKRMTDGFERHRTDWTALSKSPDTAKVFLEHFLPIATTPGCREIIAEVAPCVKKIRVDEEEMTLNFELSHESRIIAEISADHEPDYLPPGHKRFLQLHNGISFPDSDWGIILCGTGERGVESNAEKNILTKLDIKYPAIDYYSDWVVYHPTQTLSNGQRALALLSHESAQLGNPLGNIEVIELWWRLVAEKLFENKKYLPENWDNY